MFRRRARSDEPASSPTPPVADRVAAPGTRAEPNGVALPRREEVERILTEFGLVHHVDDDGDLVAPWEKGNIYFFFYGQQREVMQARLYLHRRFEVDARATLALVLDEWNRTRLSPKAYTVLPDDGRVGVCAEQCYDFELGVTPEQLSYTVGHWTDSLLRFAEWLDEQV